MTGTIFIGRCRTEEGVRFFASADEQMVIAHMAEYAYAVEVDNYGDRATPRQTFEMMGQDEYLNQCERDISDNNWEIVEVNLINDWPDPDDYKIAGADVEILQAQLALMALAKAKS